MTEPLLNDRYRLVAPLAEGGMSVVWHGHDEVLARSVAVKVIKTEAGPSAKFAQRVRREATALARLSHRHIANVYDYGESDLDGVRAPYLVMELVDGESLGAVLRRGPITWPTAIGIAAQVAGALAAAHAAGVVHCDVTPGNVMLCADGVKIIDFGIASTAGDIAEGVIFGTPAYLAPERRNGGRAIPASDVYGIGLLLYEMLAGRLPWPDGTATEVVAAHRTIPPAPLPDVPGLPQPVAALCIACLDVDPAQRPLSRELSLCLNGIVRSADPRSRRILSEVTSKITSRTTGRSPVGVAAALPDPAGALAPAAAFASGSPMGAGRRLGSGAPLGTGTAIGAGSPIGSGTPIGAFSALQIDSSISANGTVRSLDPGAPRGLGSAQEGRSRGGTRIMPHGVTVLPDPGKATEPIDESSPSWRRRTRRPFFALPSLLLFALVVCLGLSEARASNGAAAGPPPTIQPVRPGVVVTPPSATRSSAPSGDPAGAGESTGAGESAGAGDSAGPGVGATPGKGRVAGGDSGHGHGHRHGHRGGKGADKHDRNATATPELAALSCHVDYQIVAQSMIGFAASMTVTNLGQAEISGWTLQFRLAAASVSAGWNGEWEQRGSEVSVRDAGFNDAVAPGGKVTIGFVGVPTGGSAPAQPEFTLNGRSCDG
jgi:serine/threonine-protein kinase